MQFELRRLSDYSEEALLNELRRVAAIVTTQELSTKEFRKHSRVSPSTITRRFGDWQKALQAAGLADRFDTSTLRNSPDDVLAELKRVAALVEKPTLTRNEFGKHSRIAPKTVDAHFGNWQKALQAAGLSYRFDSSSERISSDEVLAEIRRVAEALDVQVLSTEQFDSHARFTHVVPRRIFGTWHKAMMAAGLQGSSRGKTNTDDECFENLLQVWTHYGRAPKQREMSTAPSVISARSYAGRFGSWIKALEAFIDRVNSDNTPAEANEADKTPTSVVVSEVPIPEREERKTKKVSIPECDKREIRLGLRFDVLKRDHFRCVVCGRSPATVLGLVLHVDHVVPWSKGGKTVIENLRSACQDCNIGKGAKHDEG